LNHYAAIRKGNALQFHDFRYLQEIKNVIDPEITDYQANNEGVEESKS